MENSGNLLNLYEKSNIYLFRRNFITFSDTRNVMVDFFVIVLVECGRILPSFNGKFKLVPPLAQVEPKNLNLYSLLAGTWSKDSDIDTEEPALGNA